MKDKDPVEVVRHMDTYPKENDDLFSVQVELALIFFKRFQTYEDFTL